MVSFQEFVSFFSDGKIDELEKCLQENDLISYHEFRLRQTLIGLLVQKPDTFLNRKATFDVVAKYRNITFVKSSRKNSLSLACEMKDFEMTKWLLEAGVNANGGSNFYCPMNQVIFNQESTLEEKKAFLHLLFQYGAKLNIRYRDLPLLKHLYRYDEKKEKEGLILLESCIPYFSEEDMKLWKTARLENVFVKKRKYLQRK